MGFVYSVYLPGLNKIVWAKEIPCKAYKDIIKSLYNKDSSSFIVHSNSLVEQIVPGILHEGLNVIDKVVLLVNARAVSVNPDLKLTANCMQTKQSFEYTVKLDEIFDKLTNVKYFSQTSFKDIIVAHSIAKARDELHFLDKTPEQLYTCQLASCIDAIKTETSALNFNNLSFEDRCSIVESLPVQITTCVLKHLISVETDNIEHKLLYIKSPYSNELAVETPLSVDVNVLREFCKLVFTDDLNNIYQLSFNLISNLGFSGEYIEKMTPAEMYLYWAIHLQRVNQQKDAEQGGRSSNTSMFNGIPAQI